MNHHEPARGKKLTAILRNDLYLSLSLYILFCLVRQGGFNWLHNVNTSWAALEFTRYRCYLHLTAVHLEPSEGGPSSQGFFIPTYSTPRCNS